MRSGTELVRSRMGSDGNSCSLVLAVYNVTTQPDQEPDCDVCSQDHDTVPSILPNVSPGPIDSPAHDGRPEHLVVGVPRDSGSRRKSGGHPGR